MKRFLTFVALAAALFSLAACTDSANIDLKALDSELQSSDVFLDELVAISEQKIDSVVNLDLELIEEGFFYLGSGMTGEEYGLFKCNSSRDAKALVALLEARRDAQYDLYSSYAVEALPRIKGTIIRQKGAYVAYVAADKAADAAAITDKFFG